MKFYLCKNILKISLLMLIFFICDRVLKYLALANKIFFYKNTGIAFSINIPENILLYLYIFIFIFLIFIIWHLIKSIKKNHSLLITTGYSLLFLGTISNLIDRIKFGFVIDYLNFYFFYNNIADIMIILGIALLIFYFKYAIIKT
ncbi:signal peptidase II [Patescibacteria group bacterium]|nr:signal peptidase II [Patescibacteria group bacterium]